MTNETRSDSSTNNVWPPIDSVNRDPFPIAEEKILRIDLCIDSADQKLTNDSCPSTYQSAGLNSIRL